MRAVGWQGGRGRVGVVLLLALAWGCKRGGDAKIAQVEAGLLPAVVIKDRPAGRPLADRMRALNVPGVSLAVIDGGKIAWAKAYGVLAAHDKDAKTPVTTETPFQAASISKPVAAMGALALVAAGKLALDEDVNAKLKSWKLPDGEFAETPATQPPKVTLRRLATHTAGLTVHGFRGYAEGEKVPTTIETLEGRAPANNAAVKIDLPPGSRVRYAGGGYTLMQLLMTDVTGKDFPALMRELVFDKLGMTHSTFQQPLPAAQAARAARGHRADGSEVKGKWHVYPELAAAGLWTTASDLARFALEVEAARTGRSTRVLPRALAELMTTREKEDVGFGLMLARKGEAPSFSHGGSNVGYKAVLITYLDRGQGAVVMTSGDRGGQLGTELLRAVARVYGWPGHQPKERVAVKLAPAVLAGLVGEYELDGGRFAVTLEEGRLMVKPPRDDKTELHALSETEFFVTDDDITLSFGKDAAGKVDRATVNLRGKPRPATRVK